ncbi:unnamed protein product [Caenorhabditis auriculariae]|uniref:Mannosyl-oligosaccharide glucosidase n=1 Tax=Caenorhabditis auriculariae TaxID=2777116 RepID=A0A8S1HC46_9PELO|nr:unnamed protein product [Caenorhabditis auriculariae]
MPPDRRPTPYRRKQNLETPSAIIPAPPSRRKKKTFGWEAIVLIFTVLFGFTYMILYVTLAPSLDKLPPIKGPDYDNKLWGTYRSHMYFGLRTRDPKSPLFGMMWYEQPDAVIRPAIRHWCNQGDGISRYGWVAADGRSFGMQNITEKTGPIRTNWINDKGGFTARISFNMLKGRRYSVIFYLVSQYSNARFGLGTHLSEIFKGTSDYLGDLKVSVDSSKMDSISHSTLLLDDHLMLDKLDEYILSNTKAMEKDKKIVFVLNENHAATEGNFVAVQLNIENSVDLEVSLKTTSSTRNWPEGLENSRRSLKTPFSLASKNYTTIQMDMGKVALSNMLGSIGYSFGYNKVNFSHGIYEYGPQQLFSAVPSRPFFPRGFLWDEGFHTMLIRKFDPRLCLEIIVLAKYGPVLARIYPRLEKWNAWLRVSQMGSQKNGYRWRGRNAETYMELNPKTLASGLDDYPRASHPSVEELHLDLRCWLALCGRVMERLSKLYGTDAEHRKYAKQREELTDLDELVKMHWSEPAGIFCDYGKHSMSVALARVPTPSKERHFEYQRVTSHAPQLQLVSNVFGYNSLFPLMLRLLPANSKYLKLTLEKIRDPKELWTEFGLRSLSTRSPYYQARNTEHDPPYWRGAIWININYMTLSALKYYALQPGPYQSDAENIFQLLRANLVRNMANQFNRTGYIWENYDDRTGEGRGSHPFNGWSSLILMIMSDNLET